MTLGDEILASAAYISAHSNDVIINTRSIPSIAEWLIQQQDSISKHKWTDHVLHPNPHASEMAQKRVVNWIFLMDLLNFSFYTDHGQPVFSVTYEGRQWTGYWTLNACIKRCLLDDHIDMTDPYFYASVSMEQLQYLLRGDDHFKNGVEMPMLRHRLELMNQAGRILIEHFSGSFLHVIERAGGSCQRLLELVRDHFPMFRDEITLPDGSDRHALFFYKRAQILIADLWACFEGEGPGAFDDIDSITMFADYRVPQCLVAIGLISYSPALHEFMSDASHHLDRGDHRELEIRGCSIHAVELLRQYLKNAVAESGSGKKAMNAIEIDFFLWDYAKEKSKEMTSVPIHRTRSIFY